MRLTLILCSSLPAARAFFGPPRPPRNPRLSSSYGDDGDEGLGLNSAASTAITLAVGASMPSLARRALRRKAPAPVVAGAPLDPNSFAGTWKLARSENMDAYLKSLNVSAAHRRLAAGASVTHEIEQTGRDCVDVCVVTRLGKSREQQKVGATRTGKDQYKRPITKRTTWESGNKLKTTTESEVGTVTDVRERIGDGMVITLTSPANGTSGATEDQPFIITFNGDDFVSLIAGTGELTRGVGVAPQFHDPWTPQNGALTATNKINRKPIEKFFAKQVKALAAKGIR